MWPISNFYSFNLPSAFVESYAKVTPDFGPVGEIAYMRTYARGKRWYKTCERVINGMYSIMKSHCLENNIDWDEDKATRSAKEAFDRMFDMKWLPPGRGLQNMGTDTVALKGGAVLNNCGFVSTRNIDTGLLSEPYTWLMDMLMLGVGVGTDVLGAGKRLVMTPRINPYTLVVPDTREGWIGAVGTILDAFTGDSELPAKIDFGQIRAKGTKLNGMGGVASGPQPLIDLIINLITLLSNGSIAILGDLFENQIEFYVNAFPAYSITSDKLADIANYIGKCVVSGGVRRSSEIILGTPDDQTFLDLKLDKQALMDRRWASNDALFAEVGMDYTPFVDTIIKTGSPGFLWLDTCRAYGRLDDPMNYADADATGTNPCGEQTLHDYEVCCLVETFPERHKDQYDYWRTLKFAYLYGKVVTLVPIHDAKTQRVVAKNRRIGTSQSGIVQAINAFSRVDYFRWFADMGYQVTQKWDEVYAGWLQINRSIKTTSVKPSGTVSLLPGSTPGIHAAHSEFYIRRVRLEDTSSLIEPLRAAGYHIEKDAYADNTFVVEIPVQERNFDYGKSEYSLEEQIQLAVDIQRFWADNQVSVTFTFDAETEGDQIAPLLSKYDTQLKSCSFLPYSTDTYVQMPYEEISEERYWQMVEKLTKPEFVYDDDHAPEVLDKFCDTDVCML